MFWNKPVLFSLTKEIKEQRHFLLLLYSQTALPYILQLRHIILAWKSLVLVIPDDYILSIYGSPAVSDVSKSPVADVAFSSAPFIPSSDLS